MNPALKVGASLLGALVLWAGIVAFDGYRWRSGDGVLLGALGPDAAAQDSQIECEGPIYARAHLASREVRFRCPLWLGGTWPFFKEFDSPALAALFLAPIDGRMPQRPGR